MLRLFLLLNTAELFSVVLYCSRCITISPFSLWPQFSFQFRNLFLTHNSEDGVKSMVVFTLRMGEMEGIFLVTMADFFLQMVVMADTFQEITVEMEDISQETTVDTSLVQAQEQVVDLTIMVVAIDTDDLENDRKDPTRLWE